MASRTTIGRVFNIQRYSIHDGDGIRTLVFLKGCPLRCLWCSNPESQSGQPELGWIAARCVGVETCGAPCVAACVAGALSADASGKIAVDRGACDQCGDCAAVCTHEALKLVGREMTVEQVLAEIDKDRPFYRRSGGGVTIGGGEPLAQARFTAELLEAAQEEYLHTAIETCGHASWPQFERVVRHVDLLHIDLKHMDPEQHRVLTGQSNELILENLKKVRRLKPPEDIIVRIPVIPGCNDSLDNIAATAQFVAQLGLSQLELIPYHRFGLSKYEQYGLRYPLPATTAPVPDEHLAALRHLVADYGLHQPPG